MKLIVNIIQITIALAMIYFVFKFWDNNNVEQQCWAIKKGMTLESLIQVTNESNVKLVQPDNTDGRWVAKIETLSPYSGNVCRVNGKGNKVLDTQLLD